MAAPLNSDEIYVRTCQECGHKQESKPVAEYKGDTWKNTKCRVCHSEALDYGSFNWMRVAGKIVRKPDPEDSES